MTPGDGAATFTDAKASDIPTSQINWFSQLSLVKSQDYGNQDAKYLGRFEVIK